MRLRLLSLVAVFAADPRMECGRVRLSFYPMKTKLLLVALFALGTAFAAEPAPLQFKGVLNTGSETLFGLSTETGDASAWVALGKIFSGFTLKSYDEAKSLLLLERDGKSYELQLTSAKIGVADAAQGTQATIADAAAVVDKLRFDEMIQKSFERQKKMMAGMSKQMAQQTGKNVDPKEYEAFQAKVMDAMLEGMDLPKMKEEMKQIYAETFTKEELAAMSDFYSTPAGAALIDKQSTVQEKQSALLAPRMMANMQKIQQLSKEFAQQQKAKEAAAKAASASESSASTQTSASSTK